MVARIPFSDIDMWSNDVLCDPYPVFKFLRDLGPVVYLQRHDLYAVLRYSDVKFVVTNWELFSSASGIAFNPHMNVDVAGTLIGSDPPQHGRFREIMERPLRPRELQEARAKINEMAHQVVNRLVLPGTTEIMSGLAKALPTTIVADLVGLPPDGRDQMLGWASSAINALAPIGVDRVAEGMTQMVRMDEYFGRERLLDELLPGSWADRLSQSLAAGEIDYQEFKNLLQINYVLPALDTTIHAIGNILWILAQRPDVWAELKNSRTLVNRAINEGMRLEGPLQSFSRVTTQDVEISGSLIPKGKRLFGSFASANRDERHYVDPDTFDLKRDASDHFAFGRSEHLCLGRNLATIEIHAMLNALLDRVESISLVSAKWHLHNALRGFSELQIAFQ